MGVTFEASEPMAAERSTSVSSEGSKKRRSIKRQRLRLASLSEAQLSVAQTPWTPACLHVVEEKMSVLGPITYVLLICLYVGVGLLFYGHVEDWQYVDAMYFSMVTMSTVGYGDLSPASTGGRVFTIFYIFVGIIVIFNLVSTLMTRLTDPCFDALKTLFERRFPRTAFDIDGNGEADYFVPLPAPLFYLVHLLAPILASVTIQLVAAACFVAVERGVEGSDLGDYGNAVWFAFITATTVGYGDMSPVSQGGRVLAFFHISVSVSLLGVLIGQVDSLREERKHQLDRQRLMIAKMDAEVWKSILPGSSQSVTKFDFVYGMLVKLELVEQSDVDVFVKM